MSKKRYNAKELAERDAFVMNGATVLGIAKKIKGDLAEPCEGQGACVFYSSDFGCEECKMANAIYEYLRKRKEEEDANYAKLKKEDFDSTFEDFFVTLREEFEIKDGLLIRYIPDNELHAFVPNDVKVIGCSAFEGKFILNTVLLPEKLERIEEKAFKDCLKLKGIGIPNSVLSIGSYAFESCFELDEFIVSNTIQNVGNDIFKDCKKLRKIKYIGTVEDFNKLPNNKGLYLNSYVEEIECNDGVIKTKV